MANRDRVILMSQMAVYDKRYGEADKAIYSYFRRDYIYRKNMLIRLCVALGALFLLAMYWLYQIFVYGIDIHQLDIQQSVTDSVLFLLAIMAFYTCVGTIQGTFQYYQVQKRMDKYLAMTKKLDRIPDKSEVDKPTKYTRQNEQDRRDMDKRDRDKYKMPPKNDTRLTYKRPYTR
ncbi:MAG: hypothetical protein FWG68_07645 [Defluviitaleaceae bacterium]|nr:hypothetical protein [Defluviitaleaceae bacterium]